ncbi:sigma 54-interacting transcriptional regulator [Desulfovibrio sp. UCD-KL4C]|uniref:sigma 54-interacting transcriptional regulator n=1 Tax=Desulfovibrio sp. UCD-KL4C TaxID=2578120 RepID=UPI0025BF3EE4|nr:sigma 54-interacting transcriptional regulator [Desulfovibrio sp. UCD-KL4C]
MQYEMIQQVMNCVSYAIVVVDNNCIVTNMNNVAMDFLKRHDRAAVIGIDSKFILPIATPFVKQGLASEDFKNGVGRIVKKGAELFFEITPLIVDDVLEGAVISLQKPSRFEELAVELSSFQEMAITLQAIFDSSSDGIWVTSGEGIVSNINKASENLNGVKAGKVVGKRIDVILKQGLVDVSVSKEVLEKKHQVSMLQNIVKTGRQLLCTGTPVFDKKGELSMVVVNERDVTELLDLREHLKTAREITEKARKEITSLNMMELGKGAFIAESKSIRRLLGSALKLSQLEVSGILLLGESGTGKSLMAKLLHQQSPRSSGPFLAINCAAVPEQLFEAELFGYEKGAFTGARETGKAGLMALADGGTFFLDEVGEMPPSVQAKLLKCIDEKEFTPLGGSIPKKINCVIIAATNKNLEEQVAKKKFRKDLFYRLNVFTLTMPPLRERVEDIFALATAFLKKYNDRYGKFKTFSPKSLRTLQNYSFPGNIRELDSLIKKGVAVAEEQLLDNYLEQSLNGAEDSEVSFERGASLQEALDRLERDILIEAKKTCGTTREMAEYLNISQPSVVRKLKKHGLNHSK